MIYIDFDGVILDTEDVLFHEWRQNPDHKLLPISDKIKYIQDIDWDYVLYNSLVIDNSIDYILTLKTKGQYERDEFEKKIDKETFQKFISSDIESLIIKNRYVYHLNNYKYEFDEYLNLKSKLYTCEVEFNDLNDLDKVKEEVEKNLSNYFKVNFTDVTLDGRYKNSNLHKYF